MEYVLLAILLVCAVVITVAVLFQKSGEKGLSGTIAGGSETYYGKDKSGGIDKKLFKWTLIAGVVFAVAVKRAPGKTCLLADLGHCDLVERLVLQMIKQPAGQLRQRILHLWVLGCIVHDVSHLLKVTTSAYHKTFAKSAKKTSVKVSQICLK